MFYKNKCIKDKKILLLQGENGRKLIKNSLKKNGFNVSLVECYKRVFKNINIELELKKWKFYKINTLLVTNSEILNKLNDIFDDINQKKWLFECKIFVVGDRLKKLAKEIGWKNIIVSEYANNDYLLKLIIKNYYSLNLFGRRKRI
nr:uroporphyrinogen-III synthase [Buchnera aphidicola]